MLQILYLIQSDDSSSADVIVYGAMLFSLVSMISSALNLCTQREIAKSTGRVSVKFDITSSSKGVINRKQNRNRFKGIQQGLAAILEIDKSLIRISRPMSILDGLRMNMNIYINHTKAIDMDINGVLKDHIGNGRFAEMVKDAWGLNEIPMITNLNVERVASKEREKRTVRLSVAAKVVPQASQDRNIVEMLAMDVLPGVPQMQPECTDGFSIDSTGSFVIEGEDQGPEELAAETGN